MYVLFYFFILARQIYIAIKYLRNVTHYDDEDGYMFPDNFAMKKYTYKWVLDFVHMHEGKIVVFGIEKVIKIFYNSSENLWREVRKEEHGIV